MSQELKLLNAKYETDVKQVAKSLDEEKEKSSDLELQLQELTERHESVEAKLTETENSL